MATSEDGNWIFQSVLQFFASPLWTTPVYNFVERNCTVFDPGEENKFAYTDIHRAYKQLVETLLTSFLDDLGIPVEEFEASIKKSPCLHHGAPHRQLNEESGILHNIFAADDFLLFKQMMVAKNIELDMQAMKAVRPEPTKNISAAPQESQASEEEDKSPLHKLQEEEEQLLQEALRQSQEEYSTILKEAESMDEEELQKAIQASENEIQRISEVARVETEQLRRALQLSLQQYEDEMKDEAQSQKGHRRVADLAQHAREVAREATHAQKQPKQDTNASQPDASKLQKDEQCQFPNSGKMLSEKDDGLREDKEVSRKQGLSDKSEESKPGAKASSNDWHVEQGSDTSKKGTASRTHGQDKGESVKKLQERQAYLKQQRERLLAIKQAGREKRLDNFTARGQTESRPKSARAAKALVDGKQAQEGTTAADYEKKLKMRLALASRLKQELLQPK